MKKNELEKNFSEEQQDVLKSIRISRIIPPILIGVGVVFYLLWKNFDWDEFLTIDWNAHTLFWILTAVTLLIIRHLSYAWRLHVLSNGAFSWKKCIELIFIWEFSSAVSPTSLGGSAVAFFVLAQERLSTAKTATIVLYTIVLDTIFFIASIPFLFLLLGPSMIRPDMVSFSTIDGWGYYFLFAYCIMATYGSIFFWGLFKSPRQIKRLLVGFTRIKWLRRFRESAISLGDEMVVASKELRAQEWSYHLKAFLGTAGAWSCRFLLLSALVIAFFPDLSLDFFTQAKLYARLQTMFVIIAFSPTPGGAGFVEILFNGFLTDYVTNSTFSTIIATIWRLLTYYSYLIIGAIIVPNWIRVKVNQRKRRKQNRTHEH